MAFEEKDDDDNAPHLLFYNKFNLKSQIIGFYLLINFYRKKENGSEKTRYHG